MTDLPETTRTRFRIAPGDVGRVQRDPGNGWLHPHPLKYEWEIDRDDLEYVTVDACNG